MATIWRVLSRRGFVTPQPQKPPRSHRREPPRTWAIELKLLALGVDYEDSRPYHPQTCGKVERLHQTPKKWLAKQRRAATVTGLQAHRQRRECH